MKIDNTLYAIRSQDGFLVKDERTGQLEIYEGWLSAAGAVSRPTDTVVAVDVTKQEGTR
tara:strand:- start:625 stop:801 length:177 start_codon:yes stop_codon:yes gene_type:complete